MTLFYICLKHPEIIPNLAKTRPVVRMRTSSVHILPVNYFVYSHNAINNIAKHRVRYKENLRL